MLYYCIIHCILIVLLYVLCIVLSTCIGLGYLAIFSNPAVQLFSCKYVTIKLSLNLFEFIYTVVEKSFAYFALYCNFYKRLPIFTVLGIYSVSRPTCTRLWRQPFRCCRSTSVEQSTVSVATGHQLRTIGRVSYLTYVSMRHHVLTTSGDIVICFYAALCLSCSLHNGVFSSLLGELYLRENEVIPEVRKRRGVLTGF